MIKTFQLTINKSDKKIDFLDFFFLLSIIAISYGINEIPILFSIYILLNRRTLKLKSKITYFLLSVLLSGTFLSVFTYFNFDTITSIDSQNIFLRIRFYWIRIIYAISVSSYLYNKSYIKIIHIIYVLAIANLITGILQLIIGFINDEFSRISMLSLEPSSSSMFYVFSAPLLIIYEQYAPKKKKYIYSFLFLGLFIISKAQIIILTFWIFLYFFRVRNILFFLLIPLLMIIYPFLLELKQISVMINLYNVYNIEGLAGFNPSNEVWTSFTLRISSWISALSIIITNPFGVGFGQFHLLYKEFMNNSEIGEFITGPIIMNILNGEGMYATPKSSLMELIVSSGLFFILPFVKFSRKIFNKKNNFFIKISCFSLILSSLMVEIAPFLTYLVFIIILNEKSAIKNINQTN